MVNNNNNNNDSWIQYSEVITTGARYFASFFAYILSVMSDIPSLLSPSSEYSHYNLQHCIQNHGKKINTKISSDNSLVSDVEQIVNKVQLCVIQERIEARG